MASAVVAQSKIVGFHLGGIRTFQTMPSTRISLPGTTNKGQTLGFHPEHQDSVLKEHHQN
jgi:hypothetical protein